MKQDIKNNELQERKTYVPASIKVYKISAHGVICASGGTEPYTNNSNPDWFN